MNVNIRRSTIVAELLLHNKGISYRLRNYGSKKGRNGNFYLFNDFRNSTGVSPEFTLKNLVKYELSSKYNS